MLMGSVAGVAVAWAALKLDSVSRFSTTHRSRASSVRFAVASRITLTPGAILTTGTPIALELLDALAPVTSATSCFTSSIRIR